jgi:hypothetical protein
VPPARCLSHGADGAPSAEFRESARFLPDAWWVRSTSGPWSHSLPTTWPQFEPVAGWSPSGRTFHTCQMPRMAAVRDYPTTGSLRVLSRNRRRGLARNGSPRAAIELPGECRRRAPTRRSGAAHRGVRASGKGARSLCRGPHDRVLVCSLCAPRGLQFAGYRAGDGGRSSGGRNAIKPATPTAQAHGQVSCYLGAVGPRGRKPDCHRRPDDDHRRRGDEHLQRVVSRSLAWSVCGEPP